MIPFDYNEINTLQAENYSDEKLLRQFKAVDWTEHGGWGLIAELCKRFERVIKEEE